VDHTSGPGSDPGRGNRSGSGRSQALRRNSSTSERLLLSELQEALPAQEFTNAPHAAGMRKGAPVPLHHVPLSFASSSPSVEPHSKAT